MPVHLIQLLCPKRHAIVALAYEVKPVGLDDATALKDFKARWREAVASGEYNPWCGICGSRELRFEQGATRWDTLEQAAPHLKDEEVKNALARAAVEKGRTREN